MEAVFHKPMSRPWDAAFGDLLHRAVKISALQRFPEGKTMDRSLRSALLAVFRRFLLHYRVPVAILKEKTPRQVTEMIIERTPLPLIHNWNRQFYQCFQKIDALFPGTDGASLEEITSILACSYGTELRAAADAARTVCALWRWQKERQIFLFDDTLARTLTEAAADMAPADFLPVDVLAGLSWPCLYIQAPNVIANDVDGFFVWFDKKSNALQILFLVADMEGTLGWQICLDPDKPLDQCLPSINEICDGICARAYWGDPAAMALIDGSMDQNHALPVAAHTMLLKSLQLIMYAVSEGADILREKPELPEEADAEAQKQDLSVFHVGTKEGEKLRSAYAAGRSTARRMHTRRGHWHSYWVGPKTDPDRRKKVLKWVPPVIVSASSDNTPPDVKITVIDK